MHEGKCDPHMSMQWPPYSQAMSAHQLPESGTAPQQSSSACLQMVHKFTASGPRKPSGLFTVHHYQMKMDGSSIMQIKQHCADTVALCRCRRSSVHDAKTTALRFQAHLCIRAGHKKGQHKQHGGAIGVCLVQLKGD